MRQPGTCNRRAPRGRSLLRPLPPGPAPFASFLSVATTSHLRHDSWLWTSLYGALAVLTGIEAGAWHAFRNTPSDTKNADAANGTGDSESTTPES